MLKIFADPVSRGIYYEELHGDSVPSTAVEITQDQLAGILAAQRSPDGSTTIGWLEGAPTAAPRPPLSVEQRRSNRRFLARAELAANDVVFARCGKAGVPYPAEWMAYDEALRAIVRADSGDPDAPMPTRPDYPVGT